MSLYVERPVVSFIVERPVESFIVERSSKDPGPEDPALSSPQRGGVYLGLQME
ncbi:hypothetical protein D1AOALGA4SA_2348 [Olavius algarvensis Delta 1 endosymbiont]|nr:hypothetical protein D1AOALGA4SA_2348 [Olavius algarvensis Delta 1 endosymbiont]